MACSPHSVSQYLEAYDVVQVVCLVVLRISCFSYEQNTRSRRVSFVQSHCAVRIAGKDRLRVGSTRICILHNVR